MATVVYVTHFVPAHSGTGADHRSYQILHDLETIGNKHSIVSISVPMWCEHQTNTGQDWGIASLMGKAKRRLSRYRQNPFKSFNATRFGTRGMLPDGFLDYYEGAILGVSGPIVVVLDHTRYGELLEFNKRHAIPTVMCSQNLDSLGDSYPHFLQVLQHDSKRRLVLRNWSMRFQVAVDFVNEIREMARSTERLCISKVEVGLLNGIGLKSDYYPYLPVGTVREWTRTIRKRRYQEGRTRGLILVIGSANYAPIRASLEWLLEMIASHGLPSWTRVVVVGSQTETLLWSGKSVSGIEVRGWVGKEELEDLLARAAAVCVPHSAGLGAVTRLPEMVGAGIPVIASGHTAYASDIPPGVTLADRRWESWYSAIVDLGERCRDVSEQEYGSWEVAQPRPLAGVVERLLEAG